MAIRTRVAHEVGEEQAKIFDFQIHIINDPHLAGEVKERLASRLRNVEVVFTEAIERYIQLLSDIDDELFRERRTDIRDVRDRILTNLAERRPRGLGELPFASIVVARDIAPSDAAMMAPGKVLAFATDLGGRTSHTAIMAAALGIPAVVGLHDLSGKLEGGEWLIVDGHRGIVVVNPTEETRESYKRELFRIKEFADELAEIRDQPAVTTDGHRVVLSANIELPEEVENVRANGAEGVGLYRTEFLYMSRDDPAHRGRAVRSLQGHRSKASRPSRSSSAPSTWAATSSSRTSTSPSSSTRSSAGAPSASASNGADIFKTQLRAILRASVHGNLKLMFPMISQRGGARGAPTPSSTRPRRNCARGRAVRPSASRSAP